MTPAVLSLTVPFIFVILITWIKSIDRQKRNQLQADLYAKAIEKGQPLPADLLESQKKQSPLNTGIILVGVGIGLSLFFFLMGVSFASTNQDASNSLIAVSSVGAIPFLVGVAFFIIHFIEKKKNNGEDAK